MIERLTDNQAMVLKVRALQMLVWDMVVDRLDREVPWQLQPKSKKTKMHSGTNKKVERLNK